MKIQIIAKQFKKKDSDETFLGFTCYSEKTKRKYNVKFNKTVGEDNIPTKSGTIEVLPNNISVNNSKLYPEIWIAKIESFEPYSTDVSKYFD